MLLKPKRLRPQGSTPLCEELEGILLNRVGAELAKNPYLLAELMGFVRRKEDAAVEWTAKYVIENKNREWSGDEGFQEQCRAGWRRYAAHRGW